MYGWEVGKDNKAYSCKPSCMEKLLAWQCASLEVLFQSVRRTHIHSPQILAIYSSQGLKSENYFSFILSTWLGSKIHLYQNVLLRPGNPAKRCSRARKKIRSLQVIHPRSKHQGWGGHWIACKWWCILHAVAFSIHTSEQLSQLGPDGASWL